MKIFGRNAVEEALLSGVTIDKLIIQNTLKDKDANRIIKLAKDRGLKIFFRDKDALDRECATGHSRHQGFIAEVTDFHYSEVEEILALARSRGEDPFVILLDGVEDPHNLGSVLRVAECAGVHGVIIPRHRAVSVNETVIKVSSGAAEHIKVAKVVNINETIEQLKKEGLWIFAADMDGEPMYNANLKGPVGIVIGGEGSGVKRLTREMCDGIISIPMTGKTNSLNASVAAGIVIYEKLRQDYAAKK